MLSLPWLLPLATGSAVFGVFMRAETAMKRKGKLLHSASVCEGCVLGDSGHGPYLQCGEKGKRFRLEADSKVVILNTHGWLFFALSLSFPTRSSDVRTTPETLRLGDSPRAISVVDGTSSPFSLFSTALVGLEGGQPRAVSCCQGTGPTSPASVATRPVAWCSWMSKA